MGAVDHASADVEGRAEPLVDGEGVDAGAGGDDVDDGVDRAYFVEVDLFDVYVVDFGFAGAEEFEGLDGGGFDFGGEAGGLDEFADDGEGAAVGVIVIMTVALVRFFVGVGVAGFVEVLGFGCVVGVGFGGALVLEVSVVCVGVGEVVDVRVFGQLAVFEDVDFGAGDAAAVDFFDFEGGAEVEGGGGVVEDLRVEAGVEEGSEEHVATDAGEAVEVGDAHGGYCFMVGLEVATVAIDFAGREL